MKAARGFIAELRRRNVIRMAGLYLVGAWLIVQVVGTMLPMFDMPAWIARSVVMLLVVGFTPAMAFAWVFELTPDGLKRDAEVPIEQSIAPRTARRMDRAIIVVLALALGYFAFDKFVLATKRQAAIVATAVQAERNTASEAVVEKSIAVLPLANASGDQDQQYFSDGLSEDLITALSQFEGLKVISRNSAFQFRDSKDDARTIGAKLGVAHLLEGSVRRLGDTVRITAQLVKARDGTTVWSQRYDRPYQDLFVLQDEITQAVAGALKAQLLAGAKAQDDRPPSGKLAAYNAFLQGKFYRARDTEADMRKAIDAYVTATRLDPHYALAWAQMSYTWTGLATSYLGGASAQQAYAQARSAVDTALALAPDLAYAHRARGYLFWAADFNWNAAEAEYRRAVELAPNDADAKYSLGGLMATLGQPEQAVELTRPALAANPLSTTAHAWLASYLLALGHLDEATQAIEKAIELQPGATANRTILAIIEIQRGDANAALSAARQEPPGIWREVAVALALQVGSDRAAADTALKTLVETRSDVAAYQVAQVYALRQDPDAMFAWLDRAWANRDSGVGSLLSDPIMLRHRGDPRFAAFCRKAGLPVPTEVEGARL